MYKYKNFLKFSFLLLFLISNVSSVHALDSYYSRGLHLDLTYAARHGNLSEVRECLGLISRSHDDKNSYLNNEIEGGPFLGNTTVLLEAAGGNHIDVIRELLAAGADPNSPNGGGYVALHMVAQGYSDISPEELKIQAEIAELLLNYGADSNFKSNYSLAPLHWAASDGAKDVAVVLLRHGADVSLKDHDGKTAYEIAMEEGHSEVADLIKAHMK